MGKTEKLPRIVRCDVERVDHKGMLLALRINFDDGSSLRCGATANIALRLAAQLVVKTQDVV